MNMQTGAEWENMVTGAEWENTVGISCNSVRWDIVCVSGECAGSGAVQRRAGLGLQW
jgi:hypothetical protein